MRGQQQDVRRTLDELSKRYTLSTTEVNRLIAARRELATPTRNYPDDDNNCQRLEDVLRP